VTGLVIAIVAMVFGTFVLVIGAMYLGGGREAVRSQVPLLIGLGVAIVAVAVLLLVLVLNDGTRWPIITAVALASAGVAAWQALASSRTRTVPKARVALLWAAAALLTLVAGLALVRYLSGA